MAVADRALGIFCKLYNGVCRARTSPARVAEDCEELRQVRQHAQSTPSDISDHLVTLFAEAVDAQPRLIVELGVRGGESTFALERAARLADAHLLSVDIEDCPLHSSYAKWSFVKADDTVFAGEFAAWCSARHVAPAIDVLFVDTSHLYEHTRAELRAWLPHLAPKGKVMLHDTNMKRLYRRADRSLGVGWSNARGVMRALEETLSAKFDERKDFAIVANGWRIRHWARCNGLTLVERS